LQEARKPAVRRKLRVVEADRSVKPAASVKTGKLTLVD